MNCEDSYTITYVYTATDNCENSTTHTQTIEVSDTTPPVFDEIPPFEITVPCDELPDPGMVTATDNCDDDVTIMFMEDEFSGSCAGVLQWTWIAKDNCGNETTTFQIVTLIDDVPPSFSGLPEDMTLECDEDIPPAAQVNVNDNCGQTMLTYGEQTFPGDCPQEYSIVRTYTAVDECENMASVSYTINIVDTTAPEFTFVGENLEIECDEELPDPSSQATDNCGEVTVDVSEETIDGDCPQEYTLIRTYTATDECGNSSTAEQTINVIDSTPPEILDVPEAETLECDDDLRADDLIAMDNCSGQMDVQYEEELIPGDCVGSFTIIRYWSATDECGNSVTETQEVTVVDTTAPEFIEGPADETVECDSIPEPGAVVFEDNCDENFSVVMTEENEPGQCPQNYFIYRTWTATDDCGNSSSYTQTITVEDTTAPELTIAADLTIECDEEIPGPESSATDNCGEVTIDVIETEEGDSCELVISRTYTATDECGNSTSQTQIITISDTTAPFIDAAEDLTLECGEQIPEPSHIANDNCNEYEVVVEAVITENCGETFTMVRTYTATDICGNSSSDTQTITVIDTTLPELSIDQDYTLECGTDVPEPDYVATDSCGDVSVDIEESTEDTCGLTYILYRTYTATDDCGNSVSATQTITFIDTTPPSLTVGEDTTVECGDEIPGSMFIAEDSCGEVSVVLSQTQAPTCGGAYILTRAYTATDECGNQTMVTQTITIVDTTDPYFTSPMPEDVEVECDMIPEVPEIGPNGITADDICSDVTINMSEQILMGDCENNYTILRTWTATDGCGNSTSYTQTILVDDTTPPVFELIDLQIEAPCDDVPPAEDVVVTDNCDNEVEIIYNENLFSGGCIGVIERTWTAIDNCGNTSSLLQYVTLTDNIPPVLSDNPADEMYGCNDEVPDAPVLTATDNCDDDPTVEFSETIEEGNCPQEYFIIRTWTAHDDCDNSMSYTQTITVTDLEAPVFTYVAGDVTMECNDELPNIGAKAIDDCGEVSITQNLDTLPGNCPQNFTVLISFTATDECGNSTTAVQTIEVVDTTPPAISGVPDDITVLCGNIPEAAEVTATDNCGEVTIDLVESGYNGTDCSGTLTRTWTATDECGNATSDSQIITIIDDIAPELSASPEDMLAECDNIPEAIILTATDNCDDDVTVDFNESIIDGNCEDSYLIVRTWTATDDCGNSSSHQQNIDVVDTTSPEFVNLPEIEIFPDCDDIPDPEDIAAIDNCDDDVQIELEQELLSGGCQGTMKRTWTATDNCGNTNVFEQFLFFQDNSAPELTVPSDYTIECDEDLLPFEEATYSDNCDDNLDVLFNETMLPGLCEDSFFIVRTWTVTDNCDNSTTDSQTISVVDTTSPTLSDEPQNTTVECDAVPAVPQISASDNCSDPEVIFNETISDGDCEDSYTITRSWSAEDDCGNATSHTQTITVIDATAPELIGDFENALVQCDDVPGAPEVSAIDNCDDNVDLEFVEMITQGSCLDNYTITRTWTATDNCGNSSTAVQVVNVVDTTDPELVGLPQNDTAECDNIPDVPVVTGTDNCDTDVEITFSQYGWDGSCEGTLFREWTATDNCGNSSTYVQEITIIDTTAPAFSTPLPSDMDVECDAVPIADIVTASDNCGDAMVTFSEDMLQGDCENSYTLTRTWVATDECGNSISHTQTINVDDTTAPVLDLLPPDITVECTDVPDIDTVGATDNCDNDVEISVEEILHSGGCIGVIERAWTAVDNCGNTAIYSQFITLQDTTAPVFTNTPADQTVECDAIPEPELVEATDNCFDGADVLFDETTDGDGCEYTIIRSWIAIDSCGNEAAHVQILTVLDTTAPEFDSTPADATVSCDAIPEAPELTASDNCSLVDIAFGEITTDGCPYFIERTWTATDACGNSTSYTQTLNVVDEEAPTFVNPPQDITDDCNADPVVPVVELIDNCDENINLTLSITQDVTDCETIITRVWMATDACGNIASHTQTVTLIDTTAPEFETSTVPADVTVECDAVPKPSMPSATDDCHDVTITLDEDIIMSDDCPSNYMIIRTWTASDGCGNTSSVSQMVQVEDTTPPEFTSFPADETYVCGDDIPDAVTPSVDDNCSEVTLSLDETINGQTELNPVCELTNPLDENGDPIWSVFLPGVGSGEFILDTNNGEFQEVDLGGGMTEGVFTGRVYDPEDTCKAFFVEGFMINKLDWNTWSSLLTISPPFINRTFKDQGGFAAAIDPDTHESWEYWELDNDRSILVGDGCYDGDTLVLEHAPANLFYGFQLGLAANNLNAAYGLGTWFTYSGDLNGTPVTGTGDFAFELFCPPCEYTISRTWTAIDECGNVATMTQTIDVTDPNSGDTNPISDNDYEGDSTFEDNQPHKNFKYKISANPNPTIEKSTITFSMNESGFATLEVFTLSGKKVDQLFTGHIEKDETYRFDFNGESLSQGIYIYRMTTHQKVITDKLILTK